MLEIFRTKGSGASVPTGNRLLEIVRPHGTQLTAKDLERQAKPQKGLPDLINDWKSDNWRHHVSRRGLPEIRYAERKHVPTFYGGLWLTGMSADPSVGPARLGLASLRVVTDAGVAAIVDAFQNTFELETFKFHALGTGTNVEAVGNTGLQTELTTQYNPDNTRATGTLAETANNIFQTVATNNVDAAVAVTEHMVTTQAATGGGTCFDRSVFSAFNLAISDGLQSDYRLTFTSGG